MLFWASFTDRSLSRTNHHHRQSETNEGGSSTEPERFGFPSLPSLQQDLEKEEQAKGNEADDDRIREAEKRGRRAFRAICESLREVHVADKEVMWWVVDMVHRAEDSAEADLELELGQDVNGLEA